MMIVLKAPIEEPVNAKVSVEISKAGRHGDSLEVEARTWNGAVLHEDVLALNRAAQRERYAKAAAKKAGDQATAAEIEHALLQVSIKMDAHPELLVTPPASADQASAFPLYYKLGGCTYYRQRTAQGETPIRLCNFTATITEQIIADDGATERGELVIGGRHMDDRSFGTARVPLSKFAAMGWPLEQWGTDAIVSAGQGARDRLREAIQVLSPDPKVRRIYQHTGWRQFDGRWQYLHAGGTIGTEGTDVTREISLGKKLELVQFPDPPAGETLRAAVRASLDVRHVASLAVTVPSLASAYRAPTLEAHDADVSAFLEGATGNFKSEMAALIQAHFGADFTRLSLPAGWSSTANSIERLAFTAKDIVLVVDDFCPTGTTMQVQQLNAAADRVFRGAGNRSGRDRLNADGSLRPVYVPRCFVLATGEDAPIGHSLRSRLVIVPVRAGDIDLAKLTQAQQDARAGQYAAAMAGYIQWLAPKLDALRRTLPVRHAELRAQAPKGDHSRTPDNVAHLAIGWELWLQFACEVGAITEDEQRRMWREVWQALSALAAHQQEYQASEEPTTRFLQLLGSGLASGRAYLAGEDGEPPPQPERVGWRFEEIGAGASLRSEWRPRGEQIGWTNGQDHVYLDADAAYAVAQKYAHTQGVNVALTPRALWKRLAERNVLASRDETRRKNYIRKELAGVRRTVLDILLTDLLALRDADSVPSVPMGPEGTATREEPGPDTVNPWDRNEFVGPSSVPPMDVRFPQSTASTAPPSLVGTAAGTNGTDGTEPQVHDTTGREANIVDYVRCLTSDGSWMHDEPWRIVDIKAGPDGERYAEFVESATLWPLTQCEPVGTPEIDTSGGDGRKQVRL